MALLSLPTEIRLKIYSLVCVSGEWLDASYAPVAGSQTRKCKLTRFPREPGIALVCRQMREEALPVFYAENTFVFAGTPNTVTVVAMSPYQHIATWSKSCAETFNHVILEIGECEQNEAIAYKFDKLTHSALTIVHNLDASELCVCFDKRVQAQLITRIESIDNDDLLTILRIFMVARQEMLHGDANYVCTSRGIFKRAKDSCGECGRKLIRIMTAGKDDSDDQGDNARILEAMNYSKHKYISSRDYPGGRVG